MAEGQGNFGNPKQHAKAGSMSSGNTSRSSRGSSASKSNKGAGTTNKQGGGNLTEEDRIKGGENSHSGGRKAA